MSVTSGPVLLLPPCIDNETALYVISPRPRRMFHTVLDATELLAPDRGGRSTVTTRVTHHGERSRVELSVSQTLRHGSLTEHLVCEGHAGLVARSFVRTLVDATGVQSRSEHVDFSLGPLRLPPDTYPEVCLPFLLRGQPMDRVRRPVHAWIADRMVARVYYEVSGRTVTDVPAGRFDTWSVLMYPDLNDWVKLPRILADLSKSFLPKYHMAYEVSAPHRLVRFEGPYGPPGAPEVILELL